MPKEKIYLKAPAQTWWKDHYHSNLTLECSKDLFLKWATDKPKETDVGGNK